MTLFEIQKEINDIKQVRIDIRNKKTSICPEWDKEDLRTLKIKLTKLEEQCQMNHLSK